MAKKEHPDWGFTYLDNFAGKIKCDHCGAEMAGGIFSQMEHVGKCEGHKDKQTLADGPTTEFMENISKVLDAPSKGTITDTQQMWAEAAQIIVVNFLHMPDDNKRAVLDKIAPADKTINHFIEFLRDGYGIELPDFAVQEYLKWKTDQTPWKS